MTKYNEEIYNKLIETAEEFFEAAIRCGFDDSFKLKKWPMMIPNFVNKAFACELYIKATSYLTKNKISRNHQLNELFLELNEKVQNDIFSIWRTIDGQHIPDGDYAKNMFYKNLEASSNVFNRFRYVHEWWTGASLSLKSSFTEKQMHLHSLNANRKFGSIHIYDGFLDQLARSI